MTENEPDEEEETKSYLVRQSCEYHVVIEATDEDDAIAQATALSLNDWSGDWSPLDAEEC